MSNTLTEFVDEKKYKTIIHDILELAKEMGATQAEVGAQCSQGLNLTVRLGEVETLQFNRDKSVGVNVYVNQHKGSASTTDVSLQALKKTVRAAIDIAKYTEQDRCAGLADKEMMAQNIPDLDLYHEWDLSIDQAKAVALECEKTALDYDKRITNSDGTSLSTNQAYRIYGNSHGFIGSYPSTLHSLSCVVIGQEGASSALGMQRDYQYTVSRSASGLSPAQRVGREAAWRTIQRLNPRKISTQNIPVIFHASVASGLIDHFLNAIEGSALYREASFLLGAINTAVFNKNITISESPHMLGGLASAPFDREGVATPSNRALISNGILQTYLLSSYSARKLKLPNTGHAGGVHNALVEFNASDLTFEALLKQMGTGLLVTELMGQGVNLVTGDYSRGASGFWVENGEIQYPVQEITIAANLKDLYQNILGISVDDIDMRHSVQTGSIFIENMMVAGA